MAGWCANRIGKDATTAALWLQQAQTLVRLGRSGQALVSLERALALDATLTEAWCHRGTLLRERQRLEEAALCFDSASNQGDTGTHAVEMPIGWLGKRMIVENSEGIKIC